MRVRRGTSGSGTVSAERSSVCCTGLSAGRGSLEEAEG